MVGWYRPPGNAKYWTGTALVSWVSGNYWSAGLTASTPIYPDVPLSLAMAVIDSSTAPLVLLDGDLNVIVASTSFFTTFDIKPAEATGESLFRLGGGEWNLPRLRSLLTATLSGAADVG